jgi:hypothetical protein
VTSTLVPPVKSTVRFSPLVKYSATDAIISTADSVYHTRRVAMNGKLVALPKNSTLVPLGQYQPIDRRAGLRLPP